MANNFPQQMIGLDEGYTSNMVQPTMTLTVAQIEALAKAGVKVELAHSVMVKPEEVDRRAHGSDDYLLGMVRDRWMMAVRAKTYGPTDPFRSEFYPNPLIAAAKRGDKVYIFVSGPNTAPHVIEDDVAVFPSDALLARLHLMMEFGNDGVAKAV